MLTHLQIRDYAIVDRLELEFVAGMSAITGETGAGKSIMLDALGLLLGDRADAAAVRPGRERAEIAAGFDIGAAPGARAWLDERELADGDDCHLRRIVTAQGRSRAYINGASQPLAALKALGEMLVDIHGQHENQSLLKRDLQRQLLDDYAGHQSVLKPEQRRRLLDDYAGHDALLAELGAVYRRWRGLGRRRDELRRSGEERGARLDLLRFQVQELNALALADGELAALETEHKRLANAEQLLDAGQRALGALYENEEVSAYGLLGRCQIDLQHQAGADPRLGEIAETLAAALIHVEEASDALRGCVQSFDIDPQRLQQVESRLTAVYALARKHRVDPSELPERLSRLAAELDQLENSDAHGAQLEKDLEQAFADYRRLAAALSRQRRRAAKDMAGKVTAAIRELGMPNGEFGIELSALPQPGEHGMEAVEFVIGVNPGQPPRPLHKIASGGELSRIGLAIHTIAADSARIPTLIFDEVDTGIGGAVAEVVGRRLRELGAGRQVLCVTHLPQVAAQAHQQYRVSKQVNGKSTVAEVLRLDAKQRIDEVARMLGGVKLTKNTLAHAREMIKRAQR